MDYPFDHVFNQPLSNHACTYITVVTQFGLLYFCVFHSSTFYSVLKITVVIYFYFTQVQIRIRVSQYSIRVSVRL